MRGPIDVLVLASLLVLAAVPSVVSAQASLVDGLGGPLGYGTACLGPNDDGSSAALDLTLAFPGGLSFFGSRHTELYVNTNGNVTFAGPLATYRSSAFPVADQPMIAPYWADVDIRTSDVCTGVALPSPESCHAPPDNGVWWSIQPGRVVVTWHRVGYYDCHTDGRMSFQLVLATPPLCALEDDFDVEFRYQECGWATGDRGGGVGGFGGEEAQAGFDAGNESDFVEIPGSRESGIHDRLCMESNVAERGVWRFRVREGGVICPDAGERCETGALGVCGEGATECVAGATSCVPSGVSQSETCNGLDDDCDGTTDEAASCEGSLRCLRGRCTEACTEFGCPPGFFCDVDAGLCADNACEEVVCGAAERCVLGVCAGACGGITCPLPQTCRAGRCVDPCAGIECGDCAVCESGRCVDRCEVTGCAVGERCTEGRCVDALCEGLACPTGEHCVGGTCLDACNGVRCPRGERCHEGACSLIDVVVDAGPPPEVDSGAVPLRDAGPDPEPDAGEPVEGPGGGCGCRVMPGVGADPITPLAAFLMLVLLRDRRGRSGRR